MNPSADPTFSELRKRSIATKEVIYRTPTCAIYKAFNSQRNQLVALKLILFEVMGNTEVAAREVENQQRCTHPHIAVLYDYFWYYASASHWVGALEVELLERDLYTDIQTHAGAGSHYEDRQVVGFVRDMVSALSAAQRMGICHRDVKPQNVFISLQGEFKLGDFGSSKHSLEDVSEMTITGTLSYLSPILRAGLGHRKRYLAHNPFKSDVYSLGLTALHMAMLRPLSIFGGDVQELVAAELPQLPYPDYTKQLLGWMLYTEEANRPDFITIENHFKGVPQAPEAVYMCQHTDSERVELQCGHMLCAECARWRESSLQKSTILTCLTCGQTIEYFVAGEADIGRGSSGSAQQSSAPVADGKEHEEKFLNFAASIRRLPRQ